MYSRTGDRPHRLLFVITVASCGGAQTHLLELLRAAVPQFDVGLATGQDGFLADAARQMNVPVFLLPDLTVPFCPARDVRALLSLVHVVRRFHPDLIHAHSSKAGLLARVAGRLTGVPSVFTAHGWAFTEGTPWLRKQMALCCEHAVMPCTDAIITVSDHDRRLAQRLGLVPTRGVHCVHNGIADDDHRARPGSAETPIISMVARFCRQKDHVTLIRALAGLKRRFRLQLIGDGPQSQEVREEVRHAGLTHCTEFLGERSDIPNLLANAHVFALTSRYEGLPISIIEAMRAGLPVVASDVGGVRELVRGEVNGFLTKPGDVERVRASCEVLLASADLRARLGAAGRRIYEQEFTAPKMIEKTFGIYGVLLDGAARVSTEVPIATAGFGAYVQPMA